VPLLPSFSPALLALADGTVFRGQSIGADGLASGEVVLVATYAKAKFDNIPISVLKMWKEAYDG
jgi:hypothetical protein